MDINALYGFVLALVLVGLVIGVGFIVLGKFHSSLVTNAAGCNTTDTASCGYAFNATDKIQSVLYDIPNTWMGLVITIVVVAIVLGIVITSFAGSGKR